jgi:hypothetical protein
MRPNIAPAPNRRPRFPFSVLVQSDSLFCASPAPPAAAGEARRWNRMVGKLTSIKNGAKRNVRLVITPTEVWSEISSPARRYAPSSIGHYEVVGLQQHEIGW